jgi:ABC-2 type transport system permease protein
MVLTISFWLLLNRFQMAEDDVIRLVVLLISYFVYFIIWALIAVLISALSKTSKGSLTTLIGIWLLLMIVLPRAAQALGAQKFPSPSKVAFEAAIEKEIIAEGDSHNPDDPHYKALKDSLLKAHNVDNVQQLTFNYSGFVMAEGERITADIYNRHQRRLMHTYEQQNSFGRYIAFINPYLALKNLSMALTGSDFASYTDFQDGAEKFRYQMAQRMNRMQMKYISNAKLGDHDKPYSISNRHWAEMPDFHYEFEKSCFVISREHLSIAALLLWLLLPLVLLFMITKKFKTL